MPNINRVICAGHLTRDPEIRTFANGGKVARLGMALNNRKKQGDQWVNDPVWLDVDVFNQGKRTLADWCAEWKKGDAVFVEGRLVLDQWTTPGGEKRQKLKIVAENAWSLSGRREETGGPSEPSDPTSEPEPTPTELDKSDIPF